MPEVDEDFLDEDVAATANGRRECMLYLSLFDFQRDKY